MIVLVEKPVIYGSNFRKKKFLKIEESVGEAQMITYDFDKRHCPKMS